MRVLIVGGGPGGLYVAQLLKRADTQHHVTVLERNRANDIFGFGVVFSDGTLAADDASTAQALENERREAVLTSRRRCPQRPAHGSAASPAGRRWPWPRRKRRAPASIWWSSRLPRSTRQASALC